ncbi:hypothetical protein AMD01_20335 [Priestia koreensis]|uniref:Uncharacterized protein n=1 Tax=Priestia koreensis TaxID=284581 RepID=A0A0M0KPZ0_9BACI|nr:hypothetical protein AMD01_20335 [Priestia koreensis]
MRNKNANKNLKYKNTHVANVADVHIQYYANLSFAVFVSVNLLIKVKFLVLKKLVGKNPDWEGGKIIW